MGSSCGAIPPGGGTASAQIRTCTGLNRPQTVLFQCLKRFQQFIFFFISHQIYTIVYLKSEVQYNQADSTKWKWDCSSCSMCLSLKSLHLKTHVLIYRQGKKCSVLQWKLQLSLIEESMSPINVQRWALIHCEVFWGAAVFIDHRLNNWFFSFDRS